MINNRYNIAGLQEELLAETERLAFVATWLRDEGKQVECETDNLISTNLFIAIPGVKFDDRLIKKQINRTEMEILCLTNQARERHFLDRALSNCERACYESEDAAGLHARIIFSLMGLAAYVYHARVRGENCGELDEFIQATLSDLYECRLPSGELLQLVLAVGNYGLREPLI